MFFRVLKRLCCLRKFMWNHSGTLNRFLVKMPQRAALFRQQPGLLLLPQFLRRNLGQFVGAGFTDEHGDFVLVGLRPCSTVNRSMAASRCALRILYFSSSSSETPLISKP